MAKVISPFKIKGKIGDLVFFENEFGPQVKPKGGPNEWQQTQDSFRNALYNAAEFKRATAAGQLLRWAMGTMRDGVKSMRLNGRMNAPLLEVIKADTLHTYGERMIASGDLSPMAGFEFNHNLSLDDALPLNIENCYTVMADKVSLQIPAFRLRKKKKLPVDATHYRLVSGVLSVDFGNHDYNRDIKEGPLQAMGRKADEAFCVEHILDASTPGSFWLVGIEFYTMVNNKPKLVNGGAMRVMGWMGPVRVEEDSVGEEVKGIVEGMAAVKEEVAGEKEVSVAEGGTPEKVEEAVVPLPTPSPGVLVNYVTNGQPGGNVIYQVGQKGWYGTSTG